MFPLLNSRIQHDHVPNICGSPASRVRGSTPNPLSTRSAGPRCAAGTRSCPIEALAWIRPHDVHVGLADPTIRNFP